MFELQGDPVIPVAELGSGPELAKFVSAVAGDAGLDLVLSGLEAARRLDAWTAAEKQRLLAQLQTRQDNTTDPDDKEWLGDEVGAVLHVAGGSARTMMHEAADLLRRLPTTHGLLAAGVLNPTQVRDLVQATTELSDDATSDVETRVLTRAAEQTNAQFRVSLRRAVNNAAPLLIEERHHRAAADRCVTLFPGENGMSTLWALLPTPHAITVMTAIQRAADHAKAKQAAKQAAADHAAAESIDAKSTARADTEALQTAANPQQQVRADQLRADQLRADALVELADRYLAGTDPTGVIARQSPEIRVTVALSTLLGLDDQPADLTAPTGRDYGPIPASMARQLATHPHATWRRLVTDPLGGLLDYGRTRYRPPKNLITFVKTRTPTCAFPTCNRPADNTNTEIDHVQDWDHGGPTHPDNLLPLRLSHESRGLWSASAWLRSFVLVLGEADVSEFEDVVGGADESPFAVHGGQAASGESAVSEVGFDVAEDGFDGVLTFAVKRGVVGFGELGVHGAPDDRRVGCLSSDVGEHGVDPAR